MRLAYYLRCALGAAGFVLVTLPFALLALLLWGNRSVSSWYGRAVSRVVLGAVGLRLEVSGRERTRPGAPCVLIGNHQSLIDLFIYGSLYPPGTVLIGKREVAWIPLFGLVFVATGNILIDRRDRAHSIAGLDKAVGAVRSRGANVWIFPEGTRNAGGERIGPFKKGAFHVAVAAQVPIVPIVVPPIGRFVDTAGKRIRRAAIPVRVLEPVPTQGLGPEDVEPLLDRVHAGMQAEFEALCRACDAAGVGERDDAVRVG